MSSHRNPSSSRSPSERTPTSPTTPGSRHGGSSTPAWMKDRIPTAELSPYIPFPDTLSSSFAAHPDCIRVPEQAQFLSVVPPSPANPAGGANIVPNAHPMVQPAVHLPPPPPAPGGRQDYAYGPPPGTPTSRPAPYPYAQPDPAVSRGIPRAVGMQAFPTRADGPWRHGA